MTDSEKRTILFADAGYDGAAADLAADYPDLNVICASESADALALASDAVVGLIAQTATVDAALLEKLPNLQGRAQARAQLLQYRC